MKIKLAFFASMIFIITTAQAMIINPYIIGDNMVVQSDTNVTIWGFAEPGDIVKVSFNGVSAEAEADFKTGIWSAVLPPMPPNEKGSTMKISDSNSNNVIKNVKVGDVWIFSINGNGIIGGEISTEGTDNNMPKSADGAKKN
ncbi:MAG TPA: hypothetical protein PK821_02975 [Victivallales bacterium]|nr:hypothetical protein [Victivallales bacterium]